MAQFVLFLGYMPIISSSLRVLDCTPPLDGVRYLRSDLRVPCGEGEHAVGAAVAYAVIVGLGVGFPAALGWMLSTASPEALAQPSFQGAWGFLIGGYRTSDGEAQRVAEVAAALVEQRARAVASATPPGHTPAAVSRLSKPRASLVAAAAHTLFASRQSAPLVGHPGARERWHEVVIERYCTWRPQRLLWWESVVMVRKAGIVLLAVLVTNPFFQSAGAALLLDAALIAHLQYQPYGERLFNLLETVSLAAAASTAIVASTLLQYDVTAPEFSSQIPAAMTTTQWAVTVVLGAVNLGTLALLVSAWLYLQVSGRGLEGAGGGGDASGAHPSWPLHVRPRSRVRPAHAAPSPTVRHVTPHRSCPPPSPVSASGAQAACNIHLPLPFCHPSHTTPRLASPLPPSPSPSPPQARAARKQVKALRGRANGTAKLQTGAVAAPGKAVEGVVGVAGTVNPLFAGGRTASSRLRPLRQATVAAALGTAALMDGASTPLSSDDGPDAEAKLTFAGRRAAGGDDGMDSGSPRGAVREAHAGGEGRIGMGPLAVGAGAGSQAARLTGVARRG
jgi:hypothetical protein